MATVRYKGRELSRDKIYFVVSPNFKSYGGQDLDMGEIFELQGLRNDHALLKHEYIQKLETDPIECECERLWAHDSGLSNHRRKVHGPREIHSLGDLEIGKFTPPPVTKIEEEGPPRRINIAEQGMDPGLVMSPE